MNDENRALRILVPVLAMILLAACNSPPIPTPDVVSTRVAIEKAVYATLTAEGPTVTATPTVPLSTTPAPTVTDTIRPTPTPSATQTPIPPKTPSSTRPPAPPPEIVSINEAEHELSMFGELMWAVELSGSITRAPTIGPDGTIYVVTGMGMLYALNPDGSLRWGTGLGQINTFTNYTSAAISPDRRIFIVFDDDLLTFESDGTIGWYWHSNEWLTSLPAFGADGTAYIMTSHSSLAAISPYGVELWRSSLCSTYGGGNWPSPVVGPNGTIYATCHSDDVFAIDPANGDVLWVYEADSEATFHASIWSAPLIGMEGDIYFLLGDEELFALEPNGQLKWTVPLMRSGISRSRLTLGAEGEIYVEQGGTLFAISPEDYILWQANLGAPPRDNPPIAISPDGGLFGSTIDGQLVNISATGAILWRAQLRSPEINTIISAPALDEDHRLYVGIGQRLYAWQMAPVTVSTTDIITPTPNPAIVQTISVPEISISGLNDQLDSHHAYEGLLDMKWSPNGELLATAGESGVLLFSTVSTEEPKRINEGLVTNTIDFRPDGSYLVTGTETGVITIWDLTSLSPISTIESQDYLGGSGALYFNPDGSRLNIFFPASTGLNGHLDVYDCVELNNPFKVTSQLIETETYNSAFSISPNGDRAAIAHFLDEVEIYNLLVLGAPEWSFEPHGPANSLAFSQDSRFIAAGTLSGVVNIYDLNQWLEIAEIRPSSDITYVNVQDIVFRDNYDELIFGISYREDLSGEDLGRVNQWSLTNATLVASYDYPFPIVQLALDPSQRYLAIATDMNIEVVTLEE